MNSAKSHIRKRLEDDISIKRILNYYISKWKWFLLSFLASVIIAFLYLRYTTPEYEATGLIRLITLNNNPTPGEAILGELGLSYGGEKLYTDEIQILKSRSIIEEVVQELDFNIQVYAEGKIKDVELYTTRPLKINLFASDSILYDYRQYFEITILSESEFVYIDEYGVETKQVYGSNINTLAGPLVITPTDYFDMERYGGVKLKVLISPVEKVADFYRDKLSVYSYSDRINRSNMIGITITDPVPEKATLFVNHLIDTYNERSIANKSEIAKGTFEFINERVIRISSDLSEVDSAKENFKVGNMVTDVNTEAGIYVEAEAANEMELIRVATELSTVNSMIAYLNRNPVDDFQTLPTNLGLQDQSISNITAQYNELVLERNTMLGSSGSKNPVVLQLNERLGELYNALKQSLSNLRNALQIRENNLKSRSEMINSRIASVPGQERENRNIQRQQNIKESIYLYLLQKREESAINMATAYPSAEVIDRAKINADEQVYPKRKLVLLAAGIVGLLIPFIIFFLKNFLNSKITASRDLLILREDAPVVGELPLLENGLSNENSRDQLSEALRILRTNLDFTDHKKQRDHKVVFVTSSINGEGKSFVAYHLAKVYAQARNKVLLLGADIRKPNLHEFIPHVHHKGLSDYLNDNANLQEIIYQDSEISNLHVINSGTIPPRPAELLMKDSLKGLFLKLRSEFDVVIVDTAPTMLVTDTMLISDNADQVLYVVRADYTEKEVLTFISELIDDKKLPRMNLLLNAVRSEHMQYGGRYKGGYAYGSPDSFVPWYKDLWNKIIGFRSWLKS